MTAGSACKWWRSGSPTGRPWPAGCLADPVDHGLNRDILDFAADTVTDIGKGETLKSGFLVKESTAVVRPPGSPPPDYTIR